MSEHLHSRHRIGPELLSAYHDDELAAPDRAAVELHLAGCPDCRDRLTSYGALGKKLRGAPLGDTPARINMRVASLLEAAPEPSAQSPLRAAWLLRPAAVALPLAAVLFAAVQFGLPLVGQPGGQSVAVAYPCEDQAECALAVRFSSPFDRQVVEQSMRIEPPLDVQILWEGDTLLLKPSEPLQPASYTLTLSSRSASPQPSPVSLRFVADAGSSRVLVPAESGDQGAGAAGARNAEAQLESGAGATPAGSADPSAIGSDPEPAALADPEAASSPTPVPETAALAPTATTVTQAAASPQPTAPVCPVQPVRGFGALYGAQPSLASALGCALGPEKALRFVGQTFEHGRLLRRTDRGELIALHADGQWRSFAVLSERTDGSPNSDSPEDTAFNDPGTRSGLGGPSGEEQVLSGALQEFERGMLLWTEDGEILGLYSDGTWKRHAEPYRQPAPGPTGTPASPEPTAPPNETAPTATPTIEPTQTPAASTPTPTATEPEGSAATPTADPPTASPTVPASDPSPTPDPTALPTGTAEPQSPAEAPPDGGSTASPVQ